MGMAATGQTAAQTGQTQQAQPQTAQSQSSSPFSSPSDAITKSIGGMFGRKKKQNQDQPADGGSVESPASGQPAAPPATPGSLMDMTVQVTSYSSDALDAGLFETPPGYAQVQPAEVARTASQ